MTSVCLPLEFPQRGTALTAKPESITIGTDRSFQPLRNLVRDLREHAARAATPEGDAVSVEPSTLEYAEHFALMLPTNVSHPEVLVDDDGEFRFEWDFGPRRVFSVAVGRDGTLNVAGLFGYESSHGEYTLGEALPPEILSALSRVGALGDRRG